MDKEMSDVDREFIGLVEQYQRLAFSVCYKITQNYFDAEDMTQETFLAVYKALPEFDGVNPGGFITRVATNKCLDYLKRAGRREIPMEDDILHQNDSSSPPPEENILQAEIDNELKDLCSSLKPPYDYVAREYYCNGRTAAEIAARSDKKVKTLQTQIRRARQMLQKKWKAINKNGGRSNGTFNR